MSGAAPVRREAPGLGDYLRLARTSGIGRAWSYFTQAHVFDLRRGTDTAHWRPTSAQTAGLPNQAHGFRYEACYTSELERCLAIADRLIPLDQADFLDLGCGKGKALLVAAEAGCRSVTGVEYDPDLAASAEANLAKLQLNGRVLRQDAAAFEDFPPRCLVFLFNPFGPAVLAPVIACLAERTTDCVVIYSNPVHAGLFAGWERVASTHGPHSSQTSLVLRLKRDRQ